jgi:hypothetical protein
MIGFEPIPQGLEGPRAIRYPTFAIWFGLRVSNPSLDDGAVGCCLHTEAERRSTVDRPSDILQLSKTPLVSSVVGSKGFEPNRPRRAAALQAACGPSARTTPVHLATAPGFEPGPASVGISDASVTPRCRSQLRIHNLRRSLDAVLPTDLSPALLPARPKNKKGLLGGRPRRPVYSMRTGPLGRVTSLIRHAGKAGLLRQTEQAGRGLPRAVPIHGSCRRGACRSGDVSRHLNLKSNVHPLEHLSIAI